MDNKYRFYEIMQAAENGEDLSQFVPKNAPEAVLLADLLTIANGGESGGSTDGVVAVKAPTVASILKWGDWYFTEEQIKTYNIEAIRNLIQQAIDDGFKVFRNVPVIDENGYITDWQHTYISSGTDMPVEFYSSDDTHNNYLIGVSLAEFSNLDSAIQNILLFQLDRVSMWGIEIPSNIESKEYEKLVYPAIEEGSEITSSTLTGTLYIDGSGTASFGGISFKVDNTITITFRD